MRHTWELSPEPSPRTASSAISTGFSRPGSTSTAWTPWRLDPAHQPDQAAQEALAFRSPELEPSPPGRKPDPVATEDHLHGEQDGEHLEHVGRAAGRERQRGNAQEEEKEQREAAASEHV